MAASTERDRSGAGLETRLAVVVALAGRGRTVALALLVFLPVVLSVAGVVISGAITPTTAERVALATQGHWAAISVVDEVDTAAGLQHAEARIDPSVEVTGTRLDVFDVPIRSGRTAQQGYLLETTAPFERLEPAVQLVAGRWPATAGEVALSQPLADSLHVAAGDAVQLAFDDSTSVSVTAVVRVRSDTRSRVIVAASGTWSRLHIGEYVESGISRSDWLLVDPIPGGRSPALGEVDTAMFRSDIPESDPIYLRNPGLLLAPALLTFALLVSAGLLLRMRRLRRDFILLSALGLAEERLTRIVTMAHLVVLVPAAVAGSVVGVVLGLVGSAPVADFAGRTVSDRSVPLAAVTSLVLVVLAVGTGMGLWGGRAIARDMAQDAGSRPSVDSVPYRARRPVLRRVAQALAAVTTYVVLSATGSDGLSSVLACLVFSVLVLSTVPDLMDLIAALARFGRPTVLLSGLGVTRDRGRSATIAGLAVIGLLVPVGILTTQASFRSREIAAYVGDLPDGQVRINTHDLALDDDALADLQAAAGAPAVPRQELTLTADDEEGASVTIDFPTSAQALVVLRTPADLTRQAAYEPSPEDVAALEQGRVLLLQRGGVVVNGKVQLDGDSTPFTMPARDISEQVSRSSAAAVGAVVLAAADLPPGTAVTRVDYRIPHAANRIEEIRAAALIHGILPSDVRIDTGPLEKSDVVPRLSVAFGLALAVVSVVLGGFVASGERRRFRRQLGDLGMNLHQVTLVGVLTLLIPTFTGIVLGLICGLLISVLRLTPSGTPLVIPWNQVLPVFGLLLGAAAVVGLTVGLRRAGPD
ncbi:hypothetical protein D1871_17890 [Nakamurella silvestris]|nr:hypothetical protein D1871_17890 [Nakamurella silvestris]